MKLNDDPRLPPGGQMLVIKLTDLFREIIRALNEVMSRTDTPLTAASSLTVTASPFTYAASSDGCVSVVGGAVTVLAYGRQGAFTTISGGLVPVKRGDSVRITYTVAPTVTFIPQ
jgi:hypothetical protein